MFKSFKFPFWRKNRKSIITKKITLGICAMDKKARSKPMREILDRLPKDLFQIVLFGDECILNQPIEEWPEVEVLIAFYSTRFPTEKALDYIKLRKPYLINDLSMETTLKDRRLVYNMLEACGIDVPFHIFVSRDEHENDFYTIEEFDEYIVINGEQINKPLVEKPVDADDHNIYIYYPVSAGGGSKRLFRKVDDRSSEFYPTVNEIRREGSFIYEEFVTTQGTDVKVYTVGAEYGHAEARKSPVVDGRVKRDSDGREIRYPVILSPIEKDMARKIVQTFRQTVCGFDILRVHGKSYCCDVNGFSFVKNSRKYYEDAAQILTEIMVANVRQEYLEAYNTTKVPSAVSVKRIPSPSPTTTTTTAVRNYADLSSKLQTVVVDGSGGGNDRPPSPDLASIISDTEYTNNSLASVNTANARRYENEELRCVIAIIRHGDRTPKQKIKVVVSESRYLDYYHSYAKTPKKDLKVKSKSGLVKFLEVTREIIGDINISSELRRKLTQIRDVLERWEISGINRKLQMKPQKWDDGTAEEPVTPTLATADNDEAALMLDTGGGEAAAAGTVSSVRRSPTGLATELLVILKWGGDLTPMGRVQAEQLGERFRNENYPDHDNGGVLRLHATYRHDLKIKASDEGRVMKTAAAFTKGLLELEGQLTPILASLVTVEEKNRTMLDRGGNFEMKDEMDRCKTHLDLLQVDEVLSDELIDKIAPECSPAIREAFYRLENPLQTLKRMHYLIGKLIMQLEYICARQYAAMEEAAALMEDSVASAATSAIASGNNSNHGGGSSGPGCGSSVKMLSAPSPLTMNTIGMNSPKDTTQAEINGEVMRDALSALSFPLAIPSNTTAIDEQLLLPGHQQRLLSLSDPLPYSDQGQGATATPLGQVGTGTATGAGTPINNGYGYTAAASDFVEQGIEELYLHETFDLMLDRWEKLHKDFYSSKKGQYDLTKVPDVYDMIRYDILHNRELKLTGMEELFELARRFETCVVPQEYGIDRNDKRYIGSKMCGALLEKIKHDLTVASGDINDPMLFTLNHTHAEDLQINSLGRIVRTRLYFTSESHLQTVLNVLRYPKPGSSYSIGREGLEQLEKINDVSYLSQIVIRLFEDRVERRKFTCELSFSSGTTSDPVNDRNNTLAPYVFLDRAESLGQLLGVLDDAIDQYHSTDKHNNSTSNTANQSHNHGTGSGSAASSMGIIPPEEGLSSPTVAAAAGAGSTSSSPTKIPSLPKLLPAANDDMALAFATSAEKQQSKIRHSDGAAGGTAGTTTGRRIFQPQLSSPDYKKGGHLKRSGSITVSMDDASDKWEREELYPKPLQQLKQQEALRSKAAAYQSSSHYSLLRRPVIMKQTSAATRTMSSYPPRLNMPPLPATTASASASTGAAGSSEKMMTVTSATFSSTKTDGFLLPIEVQTEPIMISSRSHDHRRIEDDLEEREEKGLMIGLQRSMSVIEDKKLKEQILAVSPNEMFIKGILESNAAATASSSRPSSRLSSSATGHIDGLDNTDTKGGADTDM